MAAIWDGYGMGNLEFTTAKFCPYLPEDSQANPGVYGFELAHWLSVELMRRGVVTGYPLGEDWGWFIERVDGEVELMVCCASQAGPGDGYTGEPVPWLVYVKARGGLFRKRRRPEVEAAVDALERAVVAVLVEAGIEVHRVED